MRASTSLLSLLIGAVVLALILSVAPRAAAQWSDDPAVNTPVCTVAGSELKSVAVSDGAGGVIVAWSDNRGPSPADIFAQRFDAAGNAMWLPATGVPICTAAGDQDNAAITSDGAGGAIISWDDYREDILPPPGGTWQLYAQHVDAGGAVLWAPNGVLVGASPAGEDIWSMLIADDAGGAFVAWESDGGFGFDIYAQHLDGATGAGLWPAGIAGGIPICVAPGLQAMPMLARSGDGVIITWYDARSGVTEDIYAQRVTGPGAVLWPIDGIPIFVGAGFQTQPNIVADGAGGAIITWYDSRPPGVDYDIYAQHVDLTGTLLWPVGGLPICIDVLDQQWPKITTDGAGGAIIAWFDARSGTNDIYAQRVTGAGAFPWGAPGGVAVCVAAGSQQNAKIVTDGADGAIVAWMDGRGPDFDIYAQRLDAATGALLWAPAGVPVSTAALDQDWWNQHVPMIADGSGGAIITWRDCRVGPPLGPLTDIYAQRVGEDGTLGGGAGFTNLVALSGVGLVSASVALAETDGSAVLTWPGNPTLLRFDETGEPEWAQTYSVPGDEYLMSGSLARAPDGWILGGYLASLPTTWASVMRVDEGGDVLWAVRNEDFSQGSAAILASDGGVVSTGWLVTDVGGIVDARAFLTRFEADGDWSWTTRLDSPIANSRPSALIQTSDGGYVVAGISWMNPYERPFLARYDDTGDLVWARAFTIDSKSAAGPLSLDEAPNGDLLVAASLGMVGATPDSKLMLARFDGDGDLVWANAMQDGDPSAWRAVGVSADATGAYLCSVLNPGGPYPRSDAVVIRVSDTGTFEWLRRFARQQGFSVAGGVAAVPGGVLATGAIASDGPTGNELMLASITADGEACIGSLETPATTGITVVEVDPLLVGVQIAPAFEPFSPAGVSVSAEASTCPLLLAVPGPDGRPRVPGGGIGMRVSTPAFARMTCWLALPRAVALRGQWFDLHGRRVGGELELGEFPAGDHAISLAAPDAGHGVYVLELRGGDLRGTAKAVILR